MRFWLVIAAVVMIVFPVARLFFDSIGHIWVLLFGGG